MKKCRSPLPGYIIWHEGKGAFFVVKGKTRKKKQKCTQIYEKVG